MEQLTLVANPGSASRKYTLFQGDQPRAALHFEYSVGQIICTLSTAQGERQVNVTLGDLTDAARQIIPILRDAGALGPNQSIQRIGLRVVAPSGFFLQDHELTQDVINRLCALLPRAPLHIQATLHEAAALQSVLSNARLAGISDSAFHATKPDYAWNYGLPIADADRLEIKRFGYHGLSFASVVRGLQAACPAKLIVCHLGSGASVAAIRDGQSVDTTMGYSPLEGLIMSTRSGSLDVSAARALKEALGQTDAQLDTYLHTQSGLLGLGGSDDLRVLLERATHNDSTAKLAINTYVYAVQKAIGQMAAALDGADMLVFTGTVGERSAPIRQRIVQQLGYLHFALNEQKNTADIVHTEPTYIHAAHAAPICVVPANEAAEIARRTDALLA